MAEAKKAPSLIPALLVLVVLAIAFAIALPILNQLKIIGPNEPVQEMLPPEWGPPIGSDGSGNAQIQSPVVSNPTQRILNGLAEAGFPGATEADFGLTFPVNGDRSLVPGDPEEAFVLSGDRVSRVVYLNEDGDVVAVIPSAEDRPPTGRLAGN